ncbi:MAG TPA: phenol 2-monooxygenase, partial [Acidimicrobiia bacterium]|nr:phenol 2-monooxygenase [Acidimicrobiia bacterium]
DRALFRGAMAYSLLARHFSNWYANHHQWLVALIKAWTGDATHGDSNRKVLADIADRWYPAACDAMRSITHGVAEQAGSVTVVAAADRAAAESAAELAKVGITLTKGAAL